MRAALSLAALLALGLGAGAALAQDDEDDAGIGPAPQEASALVARAVDAMGGRPAFDATRNAVMVVVAPEDGIQERHTLRLDGRYMHYASRRASGAGFDVVLAQEMAFLCDRDPQGNATYVEDLDEKNAQEGAYERDVLFMPLLLPMLLERDARMDHRGRNSQGDEVVRALIPPPRLSKVQPFVIRLRFDRESGLLTAAMGVVPFGVDRGKKRYCEFLDYRPVEGAGGLRLPHTIVDQRGKESANEGAGRRFQVRWQVNADLPATLWLRPHVEEEGKSE